MKEYQVNYKWNNGQEGSFKRAYRTMDDLGLDTQNPLHVSLYWAAFRQWLVTDRATAKRLRLGNDKTAPRNEAETGEFMFKSALPSYKEPTEQVSAVDRIAAAVADLSPAQIAELLAKAGITVVK